MVIIGLDFGERFGVGIIKDDGSFIGCQTWKLKRPTDLHFGIRLVRLEENLGRLVDGVEDSVGLAFEDVLRHAGVKAAHAYGAYHGAVHRFAAERNLTIVPVSVTEIKKVATGSGKASKEAMVDAAKSHWRIRTALDDNGADALWVAEAARRLGKIR